MRLSEEHKIASLSTPSHNYWSREVSWPKYGQLQPFPGHLGIGIERGQPFFENLDFET